MTESSTAVEAVMVVTVEVADATTTVVMIEQPETGGQALQRPHAMTDERIVTSPPETEVQHYLSISPLWVC